MCQHPFQLLGPSCMYLALLVARPDITYLAGVLARFNPGPAHWQACPSLTISRAPLTTSLSTSHHLPLSSSSPTQMLTDHGGNPDNGKSTGGYVVKISSGVVSWSFKLLPLVALSVHHQSRAPLLLRQWRRLAMTSQVPPCLEWTTSLPLLWARTQSVHYISLELRRVQQCLLCSVSAKEPCTFMGSVILANMLSFGASSAAPCVMQELYVLTECSRL